MNFVAAGRGKHYSRKRAVMERVASVIFRGGWPGRLWGLVPGRAAVTLLEHRLPILPARVLAEGAAREARMRPSTVTATTATADADVAADLTGSGRRPLRVAFASDFHIGPLTPPALLDNAFGLLAAARPDLLILGGDYVFLEATDPMLRELERRVAAVPALVKVAVLGNHDLWTHHERIEQALRRAGATVLVNQSLRLPPPFDDVAVLGLDDPLTGHVDATAALAGTNGAALTLAVAHAPEALTALAGRGVRLLVCGHTHGGQIASPWGPIVVHGAQGRRYPAGLFQLDDLYLFVSRGLGAVDLPVRTYARPDVSLFTLHAPPEE